MGFQNLISYRCRSQTRTPKNQIPLFRCESGALFFKIVSFRPATPGPSEPDLRQSNSLIAALLHARIRTHTHTHIHFCLLACCLLLLLLRGSPPSAGKKEKEKERQKKREKEEAKRSRMKERREKEKAGKWKREGEKGLAKAHAVLVSSCSRTA